MMFRDKSISKLYAYALAAVFALTLAGCGGGGGEKAAAVVDPPVTTEPTGPTPAEIDQMIMDAQDAAAAAATAADDALNAAKAAIDGASAGQGADAKHYALATTELGKAKDAKVAADAANAAAMAADTVEAAEAARDDALEAQGDAEAAQAETVMFADLVNTAFEFGVVVDAAEMYSDMAALTLSEDKVTVIDFREGNEEKTLGAAGRIASIRQDAEAARNAANRAMAARTNYEVANTAANEAEAIQARAEAAFIIIEQAADDAADAYNRALAATTLAEAETARDEAKMHYATALGYLYNIYDISNGMGIGNKSGVLRAGEARMAAETAADTYVLGLFMAANRDAPEQGETESDENYATRVERLNDVAAAAAAAAIDSSVDTDAEGTTQNNGNNANVATTVTYGLDTADDPKTADEDEAKAATRMFSVNFAGPSVIVDSADATGEEDATTTSTDLIALGANGEFNGVELARELDDAAEAKTKNVHVYSDIEQTTRTTKTVETTTTATSRPETTINVANFDDAADISPVADDPETEIDESVHATSNAAVFSGTFTYDGDNNADTDDVTHTGKFQCDTQPCTITRSGGAVTGLTGYEFIPTATQTTTTMENDDKVDGDYLAFGVWLLMPDTGNMTNGDVIEVGAFAGGSMPYTVLAPLTGTATYEGPAVGVKAVDDVVSHVDGSVTLDADFGNTD